MGAYLSKAGSSVKGGQHWRCQSGMAFGLVVIGFGDLTGFGMLKVVVLQFSMAFGVSKVVGVQIWGGLGCLSFILGFRWLSRDRGWQFDGFDSVCMLTWHGCGWRRRRGVACVDFTVIDSHGAVMWQVNRRWVVVRRWETAQGAGGAYLAVFGVEMTVMWYRKWATRGGNGVSQVAKILGASCYSPGVPGLHPAHVRRHQHSKT